MGVLPAGLLPNYRWQAFDADGAVLPLAEIFSFESGGTFSTPLPLYSDVDLTVALSNPVVADSSGRFPGMFLLAEGYDIILKDTDGNEIYRQTDVEDIGQTFLANLGIQFASGTYDVNSGYVILEGDFFVTSDAGDTTNPFIFQLPSLAGRTNQITIKHQSANSAEIQPDGIDTIDNVAGPVTLAAAIGKRPTLTLVPGPSTWFRYSSDDL